MMDLSRVQPINYFSSVSHAIASVVIASLFIAAAFAYFESKVLLFHEPFSASLTLSESYLCDIL
jgi:hypothetical protein